MKSKEITIRALDVDDAEKLLNYFKQVTSENKNLLREPDEFTLTLEDEIAFLQKNKASKHEYIAGAFDGDLLVGTAGFHGSSLKRIKHRTSIGISVLKDYYNQGIGTMLMKHIIDMAKKYHKTIIELDVRSDNIHAIKLYKNIGFKEIGIRKNAFYVDETYVDLLLMDMTL